MKKSTMSNIFLTLIALSIIIPVVLLSARNPGEYVLIKVHQLHDKSYGPAGVAQRCIRVYRHMATNEIKLGAVHECDEGTPPRPMWEAKDE